MKKSIKRDLSKETYESILNKKDVRCRFCDELVKFVETKEEFENAKTEPTMWGFSLLCPKCEYEGEIKHCYAKLKCGGIINFQDFIQDMTSSFKKGIDEQTVIKQIDYQLADRK